jgi:hypothetical protein
MADEADLADVAARRFLDTALANAKKTVARDPNFCDCDSWKDGCQFCGDAGCNALYEKTIRIHAIRGNGSTDRG